MLKSIFSIFTGKKEEVKIENTPVTSKVVCNCCRVTEKDIIKAVSNGAQTFKEVQEVTKVSTGCGRCVESNEALVKDLLMEKKIKRNRTVCGCHRVTAQDIVNAVENGAKSFSDVQAITKVGTGCGNCVEGNKAMVEYLLRKKNKR